MKKSFLHCLPALILLTFVAIAPAFPQKTQYKVAIFLYPGVELLDFAGPGEVFGATTGFDVFTVSADGEEILSQGFVTIKPEYSIATAPPADIMIFPGGSSGPPSKDPRVLDWIKARVSGGAQILTVCTGAAIVAKTGLLDGLNITTWYGFIPRLQSELPNATVLTDTRFVDNGHIITTAGVSAGIDGALHLLSRIKGMDVAKATAKYMEYDKWNPNDGRVDYRNTALENLRDGKAKIEGLALIPYEGEFINESRALVDKNEHTKAEALLTAGVQLYPGSVPLYNTLGDLYRASGRKAPLTETAFLDLLQNGEIDRAEAEYFRTQKEFPNWKIFSEERLNSMGYQLLGKGDVANAIRVFKLNVAAYPESFNVYDSLGEAYLKEGDNENGIWNYKKSLELNPDNDNARQVLSQMKTNG